MAFHPRGDVCASPSVIGLIKMISYYTRPPWHRRIQYQMCYNLPLSRAKLWVVSQLCCRTLHPVCIRHCGPGGPLDAMAAWVRDARCINLPYRAGSSRRSHPIGARRRPHSLTLSLCFCDRALVRLPPSDCAHQRRPRHVPPLQLGESYSEYRETFCGSFANGLRVGLSRQRRRPSLGPGSGCVWRTTCLLAVSPCLSLSVLYKVVPSPDSRWIRSFRGGPPLPLLTLS